MERMTEKFADTWEIKGNPECFKICDTHDDCKDCPIQLAVNKLAEYEDKVENGYYTETVLKPEDKVYFIKEHFNYAVKPIEETVYYIYTDKWGTKYRTYGGRVFTLDRLGVTVFRTYEAAELRLQDIREAGM